MLQLIKRFDCFYQLSESITDFRPRDHKFFFHVQLSWAWNFLCNKVGIFIFISVISYRNVHASFLGGRGGGGNLGVILVRVCEPVFQNLPHSYTWPLKKQTHSYTWSSKMLTYSYTALWFFLYSFLLVVRQISQSIHVWYQEDKQARKISERKKCAYTRMSEKWGLSHRNPEK